MNDEIKSKFLISVATLCFLALVAQSYYVYRSGDSNGFVSQSRDTIPESIQERLLEQMAKPDRINPNVAAPAFTGIPAPYIDPFQQMQLQMDQLFGSMSGSSTGVFGQSFPALTNDPKLKLEETQEHYIVSIELDEGENAQLETSLEDNHLKITGTIKKETENVSQNNSFVSSSMSQFSRAYPLQGEIDELGISTSHRDGEIVVTVPKKTT